MRIIDDSLKWVVHVRPLPGELLSSWLARNAKVQFTKIHTFCSSNWPSIEFWTRDIDRWPHPLIIEILANKTSTPLKLAKKTSLEDFVGKLYKSDPKTFNNHLLPWGIWHRKRKLPGLLFCPGCLEKDGIAPYYRKSWRLSLSFCCIQCGILLNDRCEFCDAPVVFFRNDFISKSDIPRKELDQCSNCGRSLIQSARKPASINQIKLQKNLEQCLTVGYLKYNPPSYFDVIFQMMWCLYSKWPRLKKFQMAVAKRRPEFNSIINNQKPKLNSFLLRDIQQRLILYETSCWILESFPKRIMYIMRISKTTDKTIIGDRRKKLPKWFISGIESVDAIY